MGWWSRFRGSARGETTLLGNRTEMIPGQLGMQVAEHDLPVEGGTLACWTFQSAGLIARGQKEMVLTFARRQGEQIGPLASELAKLLVTVWRLAEEGRIVDIGGFTEFGQSRFLGEAGTRGLGYLRAQKLRGVAVPEETLAVIPLVGDEVDAVKTFGLTRVAARLGRHYSFYPWPPWWDRGRPVLGAIAGDDASLLGKIPHATIRGMFASMECPGGTLGTHLSIRILESSGGVVAKVLAEVPPNRAFAIVPEPDPGADALMVWQQGDVGPNAISPPGSAGRRLSTCFVMIVADQPDDSLRVLEDGTSLLLRDTSWARLREAMISGQSLKFTLGERLSVSVERMPTAYARRGGP